MFRDADGKLVTIQGSTDGSGTVRLTTKTAGTVLVHVVKGNAQALAQNTPEQPARLRGPLGQVKLPRGFVSTMSCLPGEPVTFAAQIVPGRKKEIAVTLTEPAGKVSERKFAVSPSGWLSGKLSITATAPAGPHALAVGGLHLGTINVAARPGLRVWPTKRLFRPGEPVRCLARGVNEAGKMVELSGTFLFQRLPKGPVMSVGPAEAPADKPVMLAFTTNMSNRYGIGFKLPNEPAVWTNVTVAADGVGLPGESRHGIESDRDLYLANQRAIVLFSAEPECRFAVASIIADGALAWRLLRFERLTQCVEVVIPTAFEGDLILRLNWFEKGKAHCIEKRLPVIALAKMSPAILGALDTAVNAMPAATAVEKQPRLEDVMFPVRGR